MKKKTENRFTPLCNLLVYIITFLICAKWTECYSQLFSFKLVVFFFTHNFFYAAKYEFLMHSNFTVTDMYLKKNNKTW